MRSCSSQPLYRYNIGPAVLTNKQILSDHDANTCIAKESGYDLLNPLSVPERKDLLMSLQEKHCELQCSVKEQKKLLLLQLKSVGCAKKRECDKKYQSTCGMDVIAAIRTCIEILADAEDLIKQGNKLCEEFKDVFDPLPHYNDLSDEIHCKVNLRDASKTIKTCSYSCPRKYRDAWKTLIQQHLDAGRI